MYFPKNTPLLEIQNWVTTQYAAICNFNGGYSVEIRPCRHTRTNEQNRFLMAILAQMVRFYENTGFRPAGLQAWAMRTDILKEYWKARLGVASTAKLSTADFAKFVDGIQNHMVVETNGEWEVLEPDSAYVRSLIEQGGM